MLDKYIILIYNDIDKRACRVFPAAGQLRRPDTGRKEYPMSNREIESKARRLKMLKNKQETLQQEIDQLEADLKAQLEAWNVDEVQAGPFRVIWKYVNSTRFDSRRFKAENGNLYALYTVPNCYRKFSVV